MVLSAFLVPRGIDDIYVGGDDNIIFSNKPIDTNKIEIQTKRMFEMKLNFNECDKYNLGDPSMQFLGSK
jgi:hypothetical protein